MPWHHSIQVPRRRLIAAMVTLVAMVILVVTLAALGNPSWWIFLVAGLVVFFSLLDPHPGSGSGG